MAAQQITDDALDERGLLRPGRTLRVGMMFRDSMTDVQRAIFETKQRQGTSDADARARLQDAYDEYDEQQANAWQKGQLGPIPVGIASLTRDRPLTTDEGNRAKERAYAEYDQRMADAWRSK